MTDDYAKRQAETVAAIRLLGSRLNALDDARLRMLFGMWSQTFHAAGWMSVNDAGLQRFVEWATTAPCDLKDAGW